MDSSSSKRFILWDPKDGHAPRMDDDGKIDSDGVLGRVGEDNVYLTTYGSYPEGDDRRPKDLEVGESIKEVRFSLSRSTGLYDVYRVL